MVATPRDGIDMAQRILRQRLRNQLLTPSSTSPTTVARTVGHLCAVQAQDFGQAVWALGVRTPGAVRGDVLDALASGAVVRTAPMRGTLHFVAAQDLRWMLALTSARTLSAAATSHRRSGLDQATFDRAADVARAELSGGNALSRDQFVKALNRAGITTDGQRAYHLIFGLVQRALLCWGPPAGNQQALVLTDEWIPASPSAGTADDLVLPANRPRAVGEFLLRYLAGHGPATVKDFLWWSKLTVADVKSGLESAEDNVVRTKRGDSIYLDAAGSAIETGGGSLRDARSVLLLPGFDEFLLGYQDRSLLLAKGYAARIAPGKNGILLPLVIADGRVKGTWRRGSPADPTLTVDLFEPLDSQQDAALRVAKDEYAGFIPRTDELR